MKNRFSISMLVMFLAAAFALTGCPPKNKLAIDEKAKEEKPAEEVKTDENALSKELQPGDVQIQQDWTEIPSLQLVPFGYDSANIDDAARAALKANVALIKKLPKTVVVRVEGHCDDRGTVEYNIALGQRRANAVKSYYATAGIAKSRLDTISFGEERPLCNEETDACWARNRRGVTKLKNAEAIVIKADQLK